SHAYQVLQQLPTVAVVEWNGNNNVFVVESKAGEHSRRLLFQTSVDNNWILTELSPIERDLEDVFRNVTMG
ncbi:MAG TPA: hypothetical protein PKH93_03085, partial [Chitinophagales bacterium]|nr:hypothetical protein [Chitinophagales bacterium]